MVSEKNLSLIEKEGYDYIVGCKIRNVRKLKAIKLFIKDKFSMQNKNPVSQTQFLNISLATLSESQKIFLESSLGDEEKIDFQRLRHRGYNL